MSIEDFVTQRCHEHGVNSLEVCGPRRTRRLVSVRSSIASELRSAPWNLSLPEIGRALGGRHHTTVMNLLGLFERAPRRPPKKARACYEDHLCRDSA